MAAKPYHQCHFLREVCCETQLARGGNALPPEGVLMRCEEGDGAHEKATRWPEERNKRKQQRRTSVTASGGAPALTRESTDTAMADIFLYFPLLLLDLFTTQVGLKWVQNRSSELELEVLVAMVGSDCSCSTGKCPQTPVSCLLAPFPSTFLV